MKRIIGIWLMSLSLLTVITVGITYATNIYVPGSYTTIQAAVDAATTEDTIYVSPGTYTEFVSISKRIDLIGVRTPTINVLTLGKGKGVTFNGNDADNASIRGFRITGARGDWPHGGCGIYCYGGADPHITNNIITDNYWSFWCESSSPTISNNIMDNQIWCRGNSSPYIINNIIKASYPIWCEDYSTPVITNNTIISTYQLGILCMSYSSPIVTNNIICNGLYGIYEYDTTSDPFVNYNCFYNNASGAYYDEGSTILTVT